MLKIVLMQKTPNSLWFWRIEWGGQLVADELSGTNTPEMALANAKVEWDRWYESIIGGKGELV